MLEYAVFHAKERSFPKNLPSLFATFMFTKGNKFMDFILKEITVILVANIRENSPHTAESALLS